MTEKRRFPIGTAGKSVLIPVNDDGTPQQSSKAWQTMIANAAARAPSERSPAERAALARESGAATSDLARLQSAYALGERAAIAGITANPFASPQFQSMWEAGRQAQLKANR